MRNHIRRMQPNAHSYRDGYVYSYRNAYGYAYTDSHAYGHSYNNAYCNTNRDANANSGRMCIGTRLLENPSSAVAGNRTAAWQRNV